MGGNGGGWCEGGEEAQCGVLDPHADVAASQQQRKKLVVIHKIWTVARGRLPGSCRVSVLLVSGANTNLNGIKNFFQ